MHAKFRGNLRRPIGARVVKPDEIRSLHVAENAHMVQTQPAGANDAHQIGRAHV